ncbi:hypothetical protein HRR83_003668 [Exophiala dermatitidis]|uniref:Intradiol ring-cleavage dioxygenases domain-containing protein n=2 Tax=Exophiala dermatitidis TaxID=5970 RepID=H6BT15_EXODN|nr:uncharacterized protein HMPREF1120_01656 [Exophiala dermatitidis NIH/UT8656]KAJ4519023.1 hypothetical protein HRR75_002701 [Exophiala dermatitidis]EHY53464.1 hypothetical protein HMPREF1120_01656 [Exophiala dermatitidis NIH/UT8656]KAJ4522367.1 hypothetical protein HRR74_002952 [Exophiala dermatitidis]KAJ4529692.1 hypothetical protein HRR73_000720 [Exophiala dermatitidis]KAJ4543144.1 hypothetical protein HRR77_005401 [Exophiala dermatitidis]
MVRLGNVFTTALLAGSTVLAHPGHDVAEEAAERADFFKRNPKTLRSCAEKLKARGHESASIARRQALADHLRVKRGLAAKPLIHRRDFSSYNHTHLSTNASISLDMDEATLFADNSSCTLQTDVTQGPYYVNGELIRKNLVDDEPGVPLTLDIQIIDTSTCEPVPALYMDLWHANSTGVYSGVVANGNGNSNDTTNLNNTALRGIQETDSNGVVQFETVFPGHYSGRATHIHLLTHNPNSTTVRVNGTLLNANTSAEVHASHVGQLFFDQDLISLIDTVEPYSSNTQEITLNSDDSILNQEADTTDPFVEYVLLGDTVEEGILAWVSIGIDPTEDQEVNYAATHYKDGGVSNDNAEGGMGGGSPPSGTAAGSGAPPAGTMSAMESTGSSA